MSRCHVLSVFFEKSDYLIIKVIDNIYVFSYLVDVNYK